jgi:hypothetical protein
MQTHDCRLKLDAAGEHLSIVRVAIYVAYLRPMYSVMQHKESNPNTFDLIKLILQAPDTNTTPLIIEEMDYTAVI